jgi:hypothetical protein
MGPERFQVLWAGLAERTARKHSTRIEPCVTNGGTLLSNRRA